VRYATGGFNARAVASPHLTALPPAEELRQEVGRTRQALAALPAPTGGQT
jgi:hypothetical protein